MGELAATACTLLLELERLADDCVINKFLYGLCCIGASSCAVMEVWTCGKCTAVHEQSRV